MKLDNSVSPNLKIDGIPVSSFRIVYDPGEDACRVVAEKLNTWLMSHCGFRLETVEDPNTIDLRSCVVLGSVAGHRIPEQPYGDCSVYIQNRCVCIDATDIAGLTAGASYLVSALSHKTDTAFPFHTSLQTRDTYTQDPEAFLPVYRFINRIPPEELTLERKRQVLNDPAERIFVIAHRGEHTFYPENSLEAAISAWRCGADSVEVDIQKSADGIWMCMHDPSVDRTTNAAEFLGRPGFPDSPLLSNWTYEQLRQLRLTDSYGKLTPFQIPTLAEILQLCHNRMYIHIDKQFSVTDDIFPMMEEMNIFQCVYLVNKIRIDAILKEKDHFSNLGIRLDSLVRPSKEQTASELIPRILEHADTMTPAIIPLGDYDKHGTEEQELSQKYGKQIRIGAWFLRDFDYEELWREARSYGISIFMTNHPMEVIALQL